MWRRRRRALTGTVSAYPRVRQLHPQKMPPLVSSNSADVRIVVERFHQGMRAQSARAELHAPSLARKLIPDGSAQRAIRHIGRIRRHQGGIFLWVKLPDNVDTLKLYQSALAPARTIRDRNGPPTRPMPAAGCGCASPILMSRSRRCRGTRRGLPQGVSACPPESRMWRSGREADAMRRRAAYSP